MAKQTMQPKQPKPASQPMQPGQPKPVSQPMQPMQPGQPPMQPGQQVETDAYVPTYKVNIEFRKAILEAIGDRPYNEIAGLLNAVNVEVIDHNTLTQIINVIGRFPYVRVEKILSNVSSFVEQIVEED